MSGLKIGPADEKPREDVLPVAAEASVRAQGDIEGAIAKAHAEAEAKPQRVTLAAVADLHMDAIAKGDAVAAEAFASLMSLAAAFLRVQIIGENRAGEIVQGLRVAMAAVRYLEERIEARKGRLDEDRDLAARRQAMKRQIEDTEREATALMRPAPAGEDPLQAEAVQAFSPAGRNSMVRGLSTKELLDEERAMRERAKAMQRERDARLLAAVDAQRAEAGVDVGDERQQQQMSDEQLQARIEAEERLKARRAQRAKDTLPPGGLVGGGQELSYEEVVGRAQGA